METIVFSVAAVLSILPAGIGLSYLISCIREQEPRAAVFGAAQFLLMLGLVIVLFCLRATGIFAAGLGFLVLIVGLLFACGLLLALSWPTGSNQKAPAGTRGLIVGRVTRVDERDIVFARNRTLRPGSEQYEAYYGSHPEIEQFDAARRKKGGPLGKPGTIDKPQDRPNVAAAMACLSIPVHLSTPDKINPPAHPELNAQRVAMSPEAAAGRVKGYALSFGADLVGITEINFDLFEPISRFFIDPHGRHIYSYSLAPTGGATAI